VHEELSLQVVEGARDVAYVYIFENKREEVAVTLHHPHGRDLRAAARAAQARPSANRM